MSGCGCVLGSWHQQAQLLLPCRHLTVLLQPLLERKQPQPGNSQPHILHFAVLHFGWHCSTCFMLQGSVDFLCTSLDSHTSHFTNLVWNQSVCMCPGARHTLQHAQCVQHTQRPLHSLTLPHLLACCVHVPTDPTPPSCSQQLPPPSCPADAAPCP